MQLNEPDRQIQPRNLHSVQLPPVLVWSVVQLLALLLACGDVSLWAHHPFPRGSLALIELVVIQIILVGLLFPFLFPNFSTAIVLIAMIWPIGQLAGLLASIPQAVILRCSLLVSIWMMGLALWKPVLKNREGELWAVAIIGLFNIGGIIVAYIRAEGTSGSVGVGNGDLFSPALSAIAQTSSGGIHWLECLELARPLLLGIVYHGIARLVKPRI